MKPLSDSLRVYRLKVITAFLQAGVPLSKTDAFRELLEENGFSLSESSNLRKLILFILHDELSKVKMDLQGQPVAVIFNGTTHVCEAFVIVVRYVKNWVIQQKVCRLMLLAKAVTGNEVARQIVEVISTELSIPFNKVLAAMHDRASVNTVAMRSLSFVWKYY